MSPLAPPRTILLAAHGAGTDSDANRLVEALAARLRVRRPNLMIHPAFNLGCPRFPEAVTSAAGTDLIVIPLMTGPGYFVDERLPNELASSPQYDPARLHITGPIGSSAILREELLALAMAAHGADTVTLVIAHGTSRNTRSRSAAAELTEALAARLPTGADVRTAFLDDQPLLEDIAPTLPAAPLVIVPWLLGGGPHFQQDIAARLGPAFTRATVLPPLLDLPSLDDAVLALIEARVIA